MHSQYSLRSPAVKRLMREAQELSEPTETYYAHPLEDNLFEWHFTIRGPQDTEFDGGIYHGRIVLPPDYPMKPPSIILLTPNGRFEVHKKICLSISGHHPESWQPSWSIRTALLAIIGFMPTHGNGAIGSLDYSADERKVLARRTLEFKCPVCGPVNTILKPVTEASKESKELAQKEAKELAQQINFQGEKEKKKSENTSENSPPVVGSASLEGASANMPIVADPFPGLGAGNPFPMMPPFMNPMFSPPTTSSSADGTGHTVPGIPPRFFMPPFWPPNMHPPPPSQSHNQGHLPPHSFWPPGFTPGMPPGFNPGMPPGFNPGIPPAAPNGDSLPTTVSSSLSINSVTNSTSSSSSERRSEDTGAQAPPPSPVSENNDNDSAKNDNVLKQNTANISTENNQTAAATTVENSSSPTLSVTDTTNTGVRQRINMTPARQPNAMYQNAELPRMRQTGGNSGGGWCIVGSMVVIGLVLAMLIVRRLIMMKIIEL